MGCNCAGFGGLLRRGWHITARLSLNRPLGAGSQLESRTLMAHGLSGSRGLAGGPGLSWSLARYHESPGAGAAITRRLSQLQLMPNQWRSEAGRATPWDCILSMGLKGRSEG